MKKHSTRILIHIASLVGMYIFLDMGMIILGNICLVLVFFSLPIAMIRKISLRTYLMSLFLIAFYFALLGSRGIDGTNMSPLLMIVLYLIPYGVGRLKNWLILRKMNREMEEE